VSFLLTPCSEYFLTAYRHVHREYFRCYEPHFWTIPLQFATDSCEYRGIDTGQEAGVCGIRIAPRYVDDFVRSEVDVDRGVTNGWIKSIIIWLHEVFW